LEPEAQLEALLSLPALSGPIVSRDGRHVAWSWSRLAPTADVYAAPLDGSGEPVRLTETYENAYPVSWTPDGSGLIVEQDTGGDERSVLYLVRLERLGELVPLTEERPRFFIQGGELHPNGRWLVYAANLDPESGKEDEVYRVFRQDVKTGERLVLATPRRSGYLEPRLSPRGDRVLYHRNDLDPAGRQVWITDIEGGGDHEVLNFGPETKVEASWLPDGRRIVFTAEAEGRRRLGTFDAEDGRMRWLIDDPRRNVEYAFAPPGGPLVAAEMREGRLSAVLVDPESGEESQPPRTTGSFVPLVRVREGEWAGLLYSSTQPADLVLSSPSGTRSLTGLWERTRLRPEDLVPAEDFRWRSVDGLVVQGWLYRARGEAVGTVVLVHGGPTSVSEDRFNAQVQFFAANGFNVLCPNYRGSTGFGLEFQEKIKEDGWGGREQEDIRRGIEALIEAGIAEPYRVGITGTSYGGYSAWCAITRYPPEIVAAAAPVCGMTDLVVDYYSTRPDLRPYSEEMMGGSPEEIPERYRERSPINHVKNIRGRLLIVQGERDPNVTPENVRAVVKELERHGIPYELLTFADEGHGISRPKNLRVLYPRLARFFRETFAQGPGLG